MVETDFGSFDRKWQKKHVSKFLGSMLSNFQGHQSNQILAGIFVAKRESGFWKGL